MKLINIAKLSSLWAVLLFAAISCLGCCDNKEGESKYPSVHRTQEGSVTYLNDSIVIVNTRKGGLDNYETIIVNLKDVTKTIRKED